MKNYTYLFIIIFFSCFLQSNAQSAKDKEFVIHALEKKYVPYCQVARKIWGFAELGYLETKSTSLLQETLQKEGFSIETGVADLPTAFIATFGSGKPVIGILAEFDALPGLSQDSVPEQKPLVNGGSGHGCGHNLFGTGSVAAAIALKDWLLQSKKAGTVKLFGTPAEEGGGGKVYMVRAGLFKGIDAVLHWHPSDRNNASPNSCMAFKQGIFRFYGKAAHAAAAPERGRSALDGLESMNYMVNMMREHINPQTRIHYVITKGGLASNVVPDYAEAEYTVRDLEVKGVEEVWNRVVKAAEGAAMGTETQVKYEIVTGLYNLMPNEPLARAMHANLTKIGGVNYNADELAFAQKMQTTYQYDAPSLRLAQEIQPYQQGFFPASTDVGDISWVVPTASVEPATWVPGTAAHTWQAVAADGMSIGFKGMMIAAKVIAMTAIDLVNNPELVQKAKEDLEKQRGINFQYKSIIGDRKPPLEYRKGMK
jgi:aminobenzoyl-glutamate utilization protein B